MTVRTAVLVLNVAAIFVIGVVVALRVLSRRRNPPAQSPQNLTPFYDDPELEGPKLERVLKWALFCSAILAVGLPLYWLREPTRERQELHGFDERAAERGAVLFANEQMPTYDATASLRCANCHGGPDNKTRTVANGGAAAFTISAVQTGTGRPVQVQWRAPALNTVLRRFSEAQVAQIITYGRPGTPMPPWGTEGGGPKDPQSIADLVAYLKKIQLSPEKARAQAQKAYDDELPNAQKAAANAGKSLADAQEKLAAAATDKDRAAAQKTALAAQQALANSQSWLATVQAALSDGMIGRGQLLFAENCARCHTQGWSYFDPTDASVPLPKPGGSGAYGPNLTNGDTLRQFPGDVGKQQQIEWVTTGAEFEKPYGVRGISSGRMAHFGDILTKEQIKAIVDYERGL